MIHRRALITGLVSLIAAPAIVRAGSLMPVKHMWVDTFARDAFSMAYQYEVHPLEWRIVDGQWKRIDLFGTAQNYMGMITTPRQIRT